MNRSGFEVCLRVKAPETKDKRVRVKVRFFASLRERLGVKEVYVEVRGKNPTVKDVLENLEVKTAGTIKLTELLGQRKVLIMLNGEYINDLNCMVENEDELALFPPVSGGF